MGADRRGRPACLLGAADGARDGCGPIGLLAALVGKQRGLDIHVLDRVASGPKPELVRALGATYHTGRVAGIGFEPDVIVECTGVGQVIDDAIQAVGAGGVVCLTGVGTGGHTASGTTADVAAEAVLRNKAVVGSVNANKRHWYKAGEALARADRAWLARLVTRREQPEDSCTLCSGRRRTSRSSSSSPRRDRGEPDRHGRGQRGTAPRGLDMRRRRGSR